MSSGSGRGFSAAHGGSAPGAMRSLRGGGEAAGVDGPHPRARSPPDPEAVHAVSLAPDGRARVDRVLLGPGHAAAIPAARRARPGDLPARRDAPDLARPGHDRDRDRQRCAQRVADLHLQRDRPAGHARPARGCLRAPAADVAGLLHAHADGRGPVADRQRHRGHRQCGHDDRDVDRPERHHGHRLGDRNVPARLAPGDPLARVRAAVRLSDAPGRQGAAEDHHGAAAAARRYVRAGRRITVGVGDHARQDDGSRQ